MNIKRIIGGCICAVGIYLTVQAIHGIHKVSEAKGFNQDVSDFFEHNPGWWNPMIKFFGGEAQTEIDRSDKKAIMVLIGGICLTVLGATMVVAYRRNKS